MRTVLVAALLVAASCSKPESSIAPGVPLLHQVVIIDAGSSGTRAHLFQWVDDRPESLVDLTDECENDLPLARDIEGVLSSYACARPKLLDPVHAPVLVYATGGMRTLAEQQPDEAERRHADVIAALHEQGVIEVESRTISGSDEGLYQWIGVNHQEHRLDHAGETVTIIEFGGASVQVAFALEPEQKVPESLAADELRTIELGGIEYRVVARSYLHCGMNEAREALAGPSCFPSGCASSPTCAALMPTDLRQTTAPGGELATCETHVAESLATESACTALRSPPPPLPPTRPIRLVSQLASVFEALRVADEGEPLDLERAARAAVTACETPWHRLAEVVGAERNPGGLCFAAVHAFLIFRAWGIDLGDPRPSVIAVDDSWTWGVARERLDRR